MVARLADAPLLDANLLIALAWPQHVHHRVAHRWFAALGSRGWATCALTELAFVRISANPRITDAAVGIGKVLDLLQQLVALPGHRYLDDLPSALALEAFKRARLTGHNQVTDLYLLALCKHHRLRIATLDRGLLALLEGAQERAQRVELIRAE